MSTASHCHNDLNAAILSWTHELAPHGIFTTDCELRITSWNNWLESHAGKRSEDVLGRTLLEVIPSLGERGLDRYFQDALRGEVKILSRALHGFLVPLPPTLSQTGFSHMQQSTRIAPLLLQGNVCGTITIIEDVTEREWQNATLRASEEEFRVMADTVPDIIYTANANGQLDFLSQRFYDITGLPQRSGLGGGWTQIVHPDDVSRVQAIWQHSLATGEFFNAEFRMRTRDGTDRWYMSRARPIANESHQLIRWFGASTDIHELKTIQIALAAAESQLKNHASSLEAVVAERTGRLRETISHLESFSYTVAHDLRAPIRAMEAYSKILLEDIGSQLAEEPRKTLNNIGRAARHLDALTRDILSYTKVSTTEVELVPLSIDDVINNVTAMNPALQAPHSTIAVVRPLHSVHGHPTLLAQCLSNLLDNAVKFVPPEVMPRIVIRTELHNSAVRLWVEDNGIGMDVETSSRIFGIFERARGAGQYPGTGIGLAIVATAVKRMRGSYGVESEIGKGSQFWIELPSAE